MTAELERTCKAQMMAPATGLPLNELSEEQLVAFAARTREDVEEHGVDDAFARSFAGMKRSSTRPNPSVGTDLRDPPVGQSWSPVLRCASTSA